MPDTQHAIDLATRTFLAEYGGDPAAVEVVSERHEQIPNPPIAPGQVSVDLVRYRFFVELRSPAGNGRYRVEGNHVYEW